MLRASLGLFSVINLGWVQGTELTGSGQTESIKVANNPGVHRGDLVEGRSPVEYAFVARGGSHNSGSRRRRAG